MGGWLELEIKLSSGQLKLELGHGLSLATGCHWTVLVNTEYLYAMLDNVTNPKQDTALLKG